MPPPRVSLTCSPDPESTLACSNTEPSLPRKPRTIFAAMLLPKSFETLTRFLKRCSDARTGNSNNPSIAESFRKSKSTRSTMLEMSWRRSDKHDYSKIPRRQMVSARLLKNKAMSCISNYEVLEAMYYARCLITCMYMSQEVQKAVTDMTL
jgi:hypothetical protein